MPEPYVIITCEHGGNEIPEPYAAIFQGQSSILTSHRGWDPGALQVAARLAYSLRVPLFFTTISRLLIDNNRSEGHRQLFSEISRALPDEDKDEVTNRYYLPHRAKILAAIDTAVASGQQVWHLAIHSFTPILDGKERRADLGLLYDSSRADEGVFCQRWQAGLKKIAPELIVRRNYPYRGRADGLATWLRRRYDSTEYLGIEVEINQRLSTDPISSPVIADLLDQTLPGSLAAPAEAATSPGEEVVVIVDRKNRVVGEAKRREMRRRNLIHRATYILVFNRRGQIFVQKRTMSKDIYPGFYDIAAGGVVLSGESYEESARRELREELGVTAELSFLFDSYFADESNKVWGRVFRCQHDGPFVLQETEVESGAFMTPAEILAATEAKFTPDGLAILAAIEAARSGTPTTWKR